MGSINEASALPPDGPLNGLSVIIIGAGYAGISCACDLSRRGATVDIYEAFPELRIQGDIIEMDANATRILSSWGDTILDEVRAVGTWPDTSVVKDKMGNELLRQPMEEDSNGFPNIYSNRGIMQQTMYKYAVKRGVRFHFKSRITEVFDDEHSAGITLNGEKVTADLVIAADGIRSKAHVYITGKPDRPKKSGFAVFRSWFPLEELEKHTITQHLAKAEKTLMMTWITEDRHAVFCTNLALKRGTCFVTHKDLDDIPEDWLQPGRKEDMVAAIADFDPVLVQLVKCIPTDTVIDYKLLWRDPVKPWVSKNGRIALVGDAAHPHLPTSGNGAAQGIEDAATIGTLLAKAGKKDLTWALRAYEKLRFERTCLTQRLGWELRHKYHQTDWSAVADHPEWLERKTPKWLHELDANKYAADNYDAVMSHLKSGTPFKNTNVPADYVHEDWTVDEMMSMEGKKVDPSWYKVK